MNVLRRLAARIDWVFVAAIALAFAVILLTPLMSGQLPGTSDAVLHLHRLISATLNLREGILWPRWSPNLHFGFGYPLGNFYAPGWHIVGAFLVIAGMPAVTTVLIMQAVGILLYPVGGYLFGRQLAGRPGALLGAAIFLYAPFRFYELFEQGNISQFIAMGLMPWVLWAFARCALKPRLSRVATAALLLAALVVTHNLTAVEFIPLIALYALLVGWAATPHRYRLIAPLAALGLGLVLSAVYWLPVVIEVKDVRVQEAATGLYGIQSNFTPITELLGPNRTMDRAALNPPRPFDAGQPGLILAAIGLIVGVLPQSQSKSKLSRWQRAHLIGGAVVIIGGLYLMTYQSLWLWQLIPPAQVIQFPWRLMGLITVCMIPGAAISLDLLPKKWQPYAVIAGLLVIIGSALPAMPPIAPNVPEPAVITPGTSIRYEAVSGNLGAVSTYEYTPRWSTQRPLFDACPECYDSWGWFIRVNQTSLPKDVKVDSSHGIHRSGTQFQIDAPNAFNLEFHQFYFPGWKVTVDGADTPISITNPYGLMAVPIPAGTHTVEAWYDGTLEQHIGDILALLGLGLCLVMFAISRFAKSEPADSSEKSPPDFRRLGGGVTVGLLIFAIFINPITELFRGHGTASQPANAPMPIHKVYADAQGTPLVELVGMDVPRTAQPGARVSVQLYLHALQKLDAGWRVAVKLQDSLHTTDWANSDNVVPGGYSSADWPLDQYIVDTHLLTIGTDAPPYLDDVIVQIYNDAGAQLKSDSPTIAQLRLTNNQCDAPATSATVHYANLITLNGYTMNRDANHVTLDLYWHVDAAPPTDDAVFIHLMAGNTMASTADTSPIAAYPSHEWQAGQCLHNRYVFDAPSNADRVLIGFYGRDNGTRLPATSNLPLESDGLIISLR